MTTTRPTGAVGIELDRETLLAAGRAQLEAQYPDRDPQKLTDGPLPQMLIPVNRGEVAIVNGEGVGCIADEHSIIDVYFGHEYDWIKIALTLDAVNSAATDTTIDLADGIRVFGSRLDVNHYNWYRKFDFHQ